ncbi:hypothetical protein OF83DRAFT_600372 [Amylostereum chailletii]|nr:hypothetical protein OF83DRAFT_600372 [Amylostereum chailletii]
MADILRLIASAPTAFLPYASVHLAFAVFVVWNGGIVLETLLGYWVERWKGDMSHGWNPDFCLFSAVTTASVTEIDKNPQIDNERSRASRPRRRPTQGSSQHQCGRNYPILWWPVVHHLSVD